MCQRCYNSQVECEHWREPGCILWTRSLHIQVSNAFLVFGTILVLDRLPNNVAAYPVRMEKIKVSRLKLDFSIVISLCVVCSLYTSAPCVIHRMLSCTQRNDLQSHVLWWHWHIIQDLSFTIVLSILYNVKKTIIKSKTA